MPRAAAPVHAGAVRRGPAGPPGREACKADDLGRGAERLITAVRMPLSHALPKCNGALLGRGAAAQGSLPRPQRCLSSVLRSPSLVIAMGPTRLLFDRTDPARRGIHRPERVSSPPRGFRVIC